MLELNYYYKRLENKEYTSLLISRIAEHYLHTATSLLWNKHLGIGIVFLCFKRIQYKPG